MASTALAPWKSGWTAEKPLEFEYSWASRDGAWEPLNDQGSQFRDLGLFEGSKGLMRARMYRFGEGGAHEPADWRCHDLDFHFVYVLGGTAKLETEDATYDLQEGATFTQPGFTFYRLFDISSDFEMVEIVGPGTFETHWGRDAVLPARAAELAGAPATYSFEDENSYVAAAGPRPYFLYRDLGTAGPSDDRIYIHAVRMIPPCKEGGTGWHNHTMRQWFFILGGKADVDIEVDGKVMHYPVEFGDAMTVSKGQRHDVPFYTEDYFVLEMCIPKDYDTDPQPAPDAAA